MEKINIKNTTLKTGIYLIEYPNNKVYIGQAQNIHLRILEHNSRARNGYHGIKNNIQLCDKAIRKYYPEGLQTYIILEECKIDELDTKEKYWIQYYNSNNKDKGYNLLDKGNVSGRRGVDNINASVNQNQLSIIIDLLINHYEYSYKEIADKIGVSLRVIQDISWGKTYVQEDLQYPLRKDIHTSQKKDTVEDYFNNINDLIELKNDLKYSWWLSIEKDLVKKYAIPLVIMHEINNGKRFGNIGDFSYPIRKKNIRNKNNLTKNDIINLLYELKYTNISMSDLGKKYGFGRAAISNINKGTQYYIKDYEYPARITK